MLDSAEVEFLLESNSGPIEGSALDGQSTPDQEVTMSGDLDQINLTDIIQTLTISKMDGLMRVKNPLEQRQLFFHEGFVKVLAPNRVETKRLGQRLVRSGHITVEQLRSALLLQKKTHQNLKDILVQEKLVDKTDIEALIVTQVEEDLLGVFTWRHGTFEFFKGPVTDHDLRKRLDLTTEFDANGVLLEVARRQDDWQMILEKVGSLDEIVVRTDQPVPANIDSDQSSVLDAIDGKRSVRDIADVTLLQTFECGRIMREMFDSGLADRIDIDAGLKLARAHLEQSNSKLAMVTVRALADRSESWPTETALELAEILHRCGQHQWAGTIVIEAAAAEHDEETALELARQARKFSSRSLDVLKFLYERLAATEEETTTEAAAVITDLIEGMIEAKEFDEALTLLFDLEEHAPGNTYTLSKKAHVLTKLDRGEEAVEVLLNLVAVLKKEKHPEKLASVYEQILKIDYRRKDIAKALKLLHASEFTKRLRIALYVLAIAAAGLGSYWWIGEQGKLSKITDLEKAVSEGLHTMSAAFLTVDSQLSEGNDEAAMAGVQAALSSILSLRARVQDATNSYGDINALRRLQRSLDDGLDKANQRKTDLLLASQADLITDAEKCLATGDLVAIIRLYENGDVDMANRNTVKEALRTLLSRYAERLATLATTLPAAIPKPPDLLQSHTDQENILSKMDEDFPVGDQTFVATLLTMSDDKRLQTLFGAEGFADIKQNSALLEPIYTKAKGIQEAYLAEVKRTRTAQKLTPLFQAAKNHEKNFEFEKARSAYEALARNHPDKDALWRHFRNQVEKYATILRFIQILDEATAKGDFKTARGQLRTLTQAFPDIPFGTFSRLPLHIETQPPNATVYFNDQKLGTSPLIGSFLPGDETQIRIELAGHYPETTTISGDLQSGVKSLLTRKPDWVFQAGSAIDRPPVIDESGHVFIVDRGGVITAIDMKTGSETWSLETGDLSGLLPAPTLTANNCLAIASADGSLRCMQRRSGKIRWQVEDIPSESRPVSIGSMIVVATNDGRLIGLDNSSGQVRYSVDLDGPVKAGLLHQNRKVFAVTTQGTVFCVDSAQGRLLWQTQAGQGVFCTPALAEGKIAVVSDTGSIKVFETTAGKIAWEVSGLGQLTLSPVAIDHALYVADHKRLLKFDLHNGRRLQSIDNNAIWSSHLGSGQGMVFAGDRNGLMQVFDAKNLSPLFRMRSSRPPSAAVAIEKSGHAVAAFEDRIVQGFLGIVRK